MLYVAVALYFSMAHWGEAKGMHHACRLLAEETKFNVRARGGVEYAIPVLSRIVASILVVLLTGKLMNES